MASASTSLLMCLVLVGGVSLSYGGTPELKDQPGEVRAVYGTISRVLGPKFTANFSLCMLTDVTGNGTFEIRPSKAGRIEICGSTGVALARGVYWYLQKFCHASVSWGNNGTGDQLDLPQPLPAVTSTVRVTSTVKWRYYMNVCTVSYSSVWWSWERWEREIDWMALHGINLPLGFTGQEHVLAEYYKSLGLTEKELEHYFTGPAFLAWNRMGNIRTWGGPLTPEWRTLQFYLQQGILERMRSFGMKPVLPGFSGHVPSALKRVYPNIKLRPSAAWAGFNATYSEVSLLEPTDPHFIVFAKGYYDMQTKMMGTDHIYNADTFNEMIPSSSDPKYLAACSKAVYDGIRSSDPEGIWMMQGWVFLTAPGFWTQQAASAYLGGVPDEGMLILDLFTDEMPLWSKYHSYYGKQWIWCMLHDFGGRRALGGDLGRIATGPINDLYNPNSSMNGMGLTMEAIEQNPVMYALMLDMMWEKTTIEVTPWVHTYARDRYGFTNSLITSAWDNLVRAAYSYNYHQAFFGVMQLSPGIPSIKSREYVDMESLYPRRRTPFLSGFQQSAPFKDEVSLLGGYDYTSIVSAWKSLAAAASAVEGRLPGPLSYDLVDVGRQVLVDLHADLVSLMNAAYVRAVRDKEESQLEMLTVSAAVLEIIKDVDRLLATDRNYLLGHWLETAKKWAFTDEERKNYEANARYQLTLWGPDGQINDYAFKYWAGLVGDYYHMRWELLVDTLRAATASQAAPNAGQFGATLLKKEQSWCQDNNSYSAEPVGDVMAVTKEMLAKWATSSAQYGAVENTAVPNADLQLGTALKTRSVDQLKILCSINPKCVGFTTDGFLLSKTYPSKSVVGVALYVKE